MTTAITPLHSHIGRAIAVRIGFRHDCAKRNTVFGEFLHISVYFQALRESLHFFIFLRWALDGSCYIFVHLLTVRNLCKTYFSLFTGALFSVDICRVIDRPSVAGQHGISRYSVG
jgi:hypothetical protein